MMNQLYNGDPDQGSVPGTLTQAPLAQDRGHIKVNSEEFTQVIKAILEGKYSWACVLILRLSGHNPLHYIPYRTYRRLMADHRAARAKELVSNQTGP